MSDLSRAAATTDPAKAGVETRSRPALLRYEDFRIAPHNCFACGELNESGLHLALNLEAGRCWIEMEMPRRLEGWEGIIHGGILCTIMDEVMAWALVQADSWGVTAKMSVEFRKPVTVGMRIRAEGWVADSRRRIHTTAGRMVDAETGVELVRAEATYLGAPERRKQELKERYGLVTRRGS
jgi:uncharacterized protein (TIGR00369 family)